MCKQRMKKVLMAWALWFGAESVWAEEVRWDQESVRTVLGSEIKRIETIAAQPVLVAAVVAQNQQALTLEAIQQRDQLWQQSKGESMRKEVQDSEAGLFLKNLMDTKGSYTEAFLTDNHGANVATFPLTSDYWQGDEPKWSAVYREGASSYISPMEFDESSNSNSVQVSVPVRQAGATIGVLVVGIKLSHILAKQLEQGR
jgi:hypothetical protein